MNAQKDIRNSLAKMRNHLSGGESIYESKDKTVSEKKPNLDMREMLKRARKMNEAVGVENSFTATDMTDLDKETQKKKIHNAFNNQDVFVEINDFKQYNDVDGNPIAFVLSGGIDGVITFELQAGKTEETSNIEWTATPDFKEDQKNESIIERLKDFYKEFYEEWRESLY